MRNVLLAFAVCALSLTALAPAHNRFERAVLARDDVTHFWEMNDSPGGATPGACPTGAGKILDAVAAGATALASPVPLTVVTTSPAGPPVCGMPPIYFGGQLSIGFCNNGSGFLGCGTGLGNANVGSYLDIPVSVFPVAPWTISCVNAPVLISGQQENAYNLLKTLDRFYVGYSTSSQLETVIEGGVHNSSNLLSSKVWWVVTDNSTVTTFYINGVPINAPATVPSATPAAVNGAFGAATNGNRSFSGQMADCAFANTAWSLSTVQYLWSILDENGSF